MVECDEQLVIDGFKLACDGYDLEGQHTDPDMPTQHSVTTWVGPRRMSIQWIIMEDVGPIPMS